MKKFFMILSVAVTSLGTVSALAQEAAVNAETDLLNLKNNRL